MDEVMGKSREYYESVRGKTTKELEDEHRELLQHMVFSREAYNSLNGYYFILMSELCSRYAVNGKSEPFEKAREYNKFLQDILDED